MGSYQSVEQRCDVNDIIYKEACECAGEDRLWGQGRKQDVNGER